MAVVVSEKDTVLVVGKERLTVCDGDGERLRDEEAVLLRWRWTMGYGWPRLCSRASVFLIEKRSGQGNCSCRRSSVRGGERPTAPPPKPQSALAKAVGELPTDAHSIRSVRQS